LAVAFATIQGTCDEMKRESDVACRGKNRNADRIFGRKPEEAICKT
jgi:hypothetical protein